MRFTQPGTGANPRRASSELLPPDTRLRRHRLGTCLGFGGQREDLQLPGIPRTPRPLSRGQQDAGTGSAQRPFSPGWQARRGWGLPRTAAPTESQGEAPPGAETWILRRRRTLQRLKPWQDFGNTPAKAGRSPPVYPHHAPHARAPPARLPAGLDGQTDSRDQQQGPVCESRGPADPRGASIMCLRKQTKKS